MKFFLPGKGTSKPKPVYLKVEHYRINWEGKSRSKIQKAVKLFLKQYWEKHIVYEECPLAGTKLHVDILNLTKRIAVEVNGQQHGGYNKFFHNNSRLNYLKGIRNDIIKREYLEFNGFQILEINYDEVEDISSEWIKEKFGVVVKPLSLEELRAKGRI